MPHGRAKGGDRKSGRQAGSQQIEKQINGPIFHSYVLRYYEVSSNPLVVVVFSCVLSIAAVQFVLHLILSFTFALSFVCCNDSEFRCALFGYESFFLHFPVNAVLFSSADADMPVGAVGLISCGLFHAVFLQFIFKITKENSYF